MRVRPDKVFELGALSFQFVPVFFVAANMSTPLRHTLNSDAVGCIQVSVDKYCSIRDAPVSNTKSSVSLQCDTAAVKAVFLLIAVNLPER